MSNSKGIIPAPLPFETPVWIFCTPSAVQQIDTLKVARRYFMFNSNKLGDLGQHLRLGKKESTGGFELWVGCMKGEAKAWSRMIQYARQDVNLLMDVYYKLRPFMNNHPNKNLINRRVLHFCKNSFFI